ncbi:MAG: SDR family NAD(P)-dependent oxidoreductase [Treponema sp.]|nr:SDR family NAD(P)-dependent oxidoreductase [Treponema sp.]
MSKTAKYLRFWTQYGPWALVAGGSDGLGAAFAEALALRGINLVLMARQKDRLEAAADELRKKYAVDVITFAVDLADYEKTKKLINDLLSNPEEFAAAKLPVSIGLLVYNAAFAPIGLFENTSEEHLSLAAAVNVRTPLLLAKLLSAPMIQNKRGGIVLMSSLAGMQGSPKLAAYSATKSFNAVLAEALWKEFLPHGVDVIGSCAGAILTPGYRQAAKKKAAPGALTAEKVAEKTLNALGKQPIVVPGFVNKIAKFVLTKVLTKKAAIDIMDKNTGSLS